MNMLPSARSRPASLDPAGSGGRLTDALADLALAGLVVAGICVQVLLLGEYTGDDVNTLLPVARHSVALTIFYYIRPIEYLIVQVANQVAMPLWIAVSGLCAVGAAWIQVRNVEILLGRAFPAALRRAIVAGSPLWFYAVSQVDTVSQSLCNLAFAGALHCLLRVLTEPSRERTDRWLVGLNLLAAVLLYTKELAITASCILPAIGAWLAWRRRRAGAGYLASGLLFVAALGLWVYLKLTFKSMMPEASGHYNLSPGLGDIARNTIATLAFGVTPLPTSLLSLARLATLWTACGVAATLVLLWAAIRLPWRTPAVRWLACAVVVGCIPMFYVHASELYASMLAPLFVALVIGQLAPPRVAAFGYCVLLAACSYVNAWVYFHADRLHALGIERTPYSVYWGPNGVAFEKKPGELACPILRTTGVAWDCGVLVCQGRDGDVARTPIPHAPTCAKPPAP
jgi:hypothetical protein